MSYINEALKKAQELKDSGYGKYSMASQSPDSNRRGLGIRVLIISASVAVLIFLLFLGYKWSGFSHDNKNIETAASIGLSELKDLTLDRKALYEKASDLFKEGKTGEAKKVYEAVIALDPGYVEALNNLGIIYIQERNFDTAGKTFEKAVRLNPSCVESYYNLACLHAIKGNSEQGLRYLEKAISLDVNVKGWAADDSDLDGLRGSDKFKKMIAQ